MPVQSRGIDDSPLYGKRELLTEKSSSTTTPGLRYNRRMNPLPEDVTPETAAMLRAHATAQGLSVDVYLRALLGLGIAEHPLADMSEEDFAVLMEEFVKG